MHPVVFLICSATPPGKVPFVECNSTKSAVSTDSRASERVTMFSQMMRRFVRGSICSVPFVEAAFQFQSAAWLTPSAPTSIIAKRTMKTALICALFSDLLLDTRMHSTLGLVFALAVMILASSLSAVWEPVRVWVVQNHAPCKATLRRVLYAVLILELIIDPRMQRAFLAFLSLLPLFISYVGLFAACVCVLYILRPHAWRLRSFIAALRQLCLEQTTKRRIMAIIAADQRPVSTYMWNGNGTSQSVSELSNAESPMVLVGSTLFSECLCAACHHASSLAQKTPALIKSFGVPKVALNRVTSSSITALASVLVFLGKCLMVMNDACTEVCNFAVTAPTQRRDRRRSRTPERRKCHKEMVKVKTGSMVAEEKIASTVQEVAVQKVAKEYGVESMLRRRMLQVVCAVRKHGWCAKILRALLPF